MREAYRALPRLGPIGAGLVGGVTGLLLTGAFVLCFDHVLPFLAGTPAPAPRTVSPGLMMAVVLAPSGALYLAGHLAAARAVRTAQLVVAMALALGLLVAGWALIADLVTHGS